MHNREGKPAIRCQVSTAIYIVYQSSIIKTNHLATAAVADTAAENQNVMTSLIIFFSPLFPRRRRRRRARQRSQDDRIGCGPQ